MKREKLIHNIIVETQSTGLMMMKVLNDERFTQDEQDLVLNCYNEIRQVLEKVKTLEGVNNEKNN